MTRVLVPALSKALADFFESHAKKLEEKSAVKTAKAASTAEELRIASRKLSDASSR